MGLRAYSMLNLMAGRRVRSEAFWPDPSEEQEKGRSVGRDEKRLSCVGPAARWLVGGDGRRARSQSAWFEATDDARNEPKRGTRRGTRLVSIWMFDAGAESGFDVGIYVDVGMSIPTSIWSVCCRQPQLLLRSPLQVHLKCHCPSSTPAALSRAQSSTKETGTVSGVSRYLTPT